MPKLNYVKKARKDYPDSGIQKGDSYYWWAFAFGPKFKSKTRPDRSQLTQSSFLKSVYALQDSIMERFTDIDMVEDEVQNLLDELETLKEECQESLENMPEHLQESSDSGILLQERIDNLEECVGCIESIDIDFDDENISKEEKEEKFGCVIDEIIEFMGVIE